MATQRIGESAPIFGTIDELFAVLENINPVTDVEETELLDGDSDVIAVDQHTKRQKITAELTTKAAGFPLAANVGSGALFDVNPTDSDLSLLRCICVRSVRQRQRANIARFQ